MPVVRTSAQAKGFGSSVTACAASLQRRPDIVQMRRDRGGMDPERVALSLCVDAREVALEPLFLLLGSGEPASHLRRGHDLR